MLLDVTYITEEVESGVKERLVQQVPNVSQLVLAEWFFETFGSH